jgi:hypothetical protein
LICTPHLAAIALAFMKLDKSSKISLGNSELSPKITAFLGLFLLSIHPLGYSKII